MNDECKVTNSSKCKRKAQQLQQISDSIIMFLDYQIYSVEYSWMTSLSIGGHTFSMKEPTGFKVCIFEDNTVKGKTRTRLLNQNIQLTLHLRTNSSHPEEKIFLENKLNVIDCEMSLFAHLSLPPISLRKYSSFSQKEVLICIQCQQQCKRLSQCDACLCGTTHCSSLVKWHVNESYVKNTYRLIY